MVEVKNFAGIPDEPFKPFPVKLLKDVPLGGGNKALKGSTVSAMSVPSGQLYLMSPGRTDEVMLSEPRLNVDYKFLEPLIDIYSVNPDGSLHELLERHIGYNAEALKAALKEWKKSTGKKIGTITDPETRAQIQEDLSKDFQMKFSKWEK